MDNKGMTIFLIIDSIVLLALIVAKTVLFFKAARKKTIRRWFYFNTYDIQDAPSDHLKKLRKKQNTFTTVIFIAIVLSVIIGLLLFAAD